MLEIAITVVVILILLILPVRIAAKYMHAERNGAFMCLLAIILSSGLNSGVFTYFQHSGQWLIAISLLVSLLISGFAYMLVLGTTLMGGVLISIIQTVLTLLMVFVVLLLGIALNVTLLN